MKNQRQFSIHSIAALFITIACNTLFAQQNAIKITPLQPVIGKFTVHYERVVAPKTTLVFGYQRWFESRSSGTALIFPIFLASSESRTRVTGGRVNFSVRKYAHTAMHGLFGEVGAYMGKQQVTETTSGSLLIFFHNTSDTKTVKVSEQGLRLGGGVHKTIDCFSFEFSTGLSFNGNSKDIEPTFGMKPVSVYTNIAIGLNF